ncbi:CotH kinase family protein [Marinobacter sp. V034]|uniref:CotH kinase family protein n=1 Tax=Marinobacter sp. V034 TaxID=3459610 RepID=UPI004043E35E
MRTTNNRRTETLLSLRFAGSVCMLALAITGCGGSESETTSPSAVEPPREPVNIGGEGPLYETDRVLAVDITMEPGAFRQLRSEGRTLASTARECIPEYEYTEFTAIVSIDGERMEDVIVRKKGYMGSLSPSIPSLKLDFNDLWKGRTYQNSNRMTLNNNRQDPSNARQCLAYDQFRAAGIGAPMCNYAKVSVNGQNLGIFTNVEPIKDPFLKRVFGDDDGNQYEAQTADFGEFLSQRFEKKNHEKENDRADLQALNVALALPDEQMMNVLPQLLDVDEFIKFWAVETLIGAWDSATGNANNFHIYRDTNDGLFHFIPWGPDTAFRGEHPLKPMTGVLYRNFSLANRLFEMPTYRAKYAAELEDLLATQWNEADLISRLNEIAQLTDTPTQNTESVKTFVSGKGDPGDDDYRPSRRVAIEQALALPVQNDQVYLLEDRAPDCISPVTTSLTGSFKAENGKDTGSFLFTLPDGHAVSASLTFAAFEVDSLVYSVDREASPEVISLLLIGVDVNNAFKPYVLQLFVEATDFVPGEHRVHGLATNAILFEVDESLPGDVRTLAMGATGSVTINKVGDAGSEGDVDMTLSITLEYGPEVP